MLYLANRSRAHTINTHRALQAADGYLYLGMADEALMELNAISPAEQEKTVRSPRADPGALASSASGKEAEALSGRGAVEHPDEDEFTVQQAFALHQLEKGEEAVEVLLAAPEWIRRTGILHYNLACYEARLGDLKTARQCINAAIQINAAMKKNARVDPDLQGLWVLPKGGLNS
jgi:tetratricopeptide (TPR) repeat protein